MRRIGIVLVALGIFALVFGWNQRDTPKTTADIGPIEATARHALPLSPIMAGITIVGGLALLAAPHLRRS